jgi:hypothetical protein
MNGQLNEGQGTSRNEKIYVAKSTASWNSELEHCPVAALEKWQTWQV